MKSKLDLITQYFHGIQNPNIYHGFGKTGPYFEGWFYKLVDKKGGQRWSIIPGVYIGADKRDSHSFIQILDSANGKTYYINFPYEKFISHHRDFQVSLGDCEFSENRITLNFKNEEIEINGSLEFTHLNPWPQTLISPGIMGWYAWVPGMECYHGVLSLDHSIEGSLVINTEKIDFTGGRGYIEKDWGKAMPKAWIWLQCNHFSKPGTSVTASVATIPWGSFSFDGFIVGLMLDDGLYKFATYTGAKIELIQVDNHAVNLVFLDKKKRLQIMARRLTGGMLKAPTILQMDRRISETLSAEVGIELSVRQSRSWRTILIDNGHHAGLEVVGNLRN